MTTIIENRGGVLRLNLSGEVGDPNGIIARDVIEAVSRSTHTSIRATLNSAGGSVTEGFAIHNVISRFAGPTTVVIDGVAASMASVIAMAFKKIVMPSNAWLMIHDPSGSVSGNSHDLRKIADLIDRMREQIVTAYHKRSKRPVAEIEQMMTSETWLSADDAVRLGFADELEAPVAIAAIDLSRFKSAPKIASGAASLIDPITKQIDVAAVYQRFNSVKVSR